MMNILQCGSIAYSIVVLSLVIAFGKLLGKYKIYGISIGGCWILFAGIAFSHFGMSLNSEVLHFLKEFGLILFVYSIGLQVGPGFFSSFKNGGAKANSLSFIAIILSVLITLGIRLVTHEDLTTMVGIMSGAVTNTPGLGAAQQTFADLTGGPAPEMAMGYAISYPIGVLGVILSFIFLKSFNKNSQAINKINSPIPSFDKQIVEYGNSRYISRRILVSKRKVNGITLSQLDFQNNLGATVTRIRRAGIELQVRPEVKLQYGDLLTVTGPEQSVMAVEKVLGNSRKRLDEPNLVPIFIGIAAGCAIGSIPFKIPFIPQPIKLGLAAGPLIMSILISYFGPKFKVITYTTASANLMLREVGISIFLACVGLEAGNGFIDTIIHNGGYLWIMYGLIITILPIIICGLIGHFILKLDYNVLLGVLAGTNTNPPALAFASEQDKNSDNAAVGYATVYPLSMFLRVLIAQIIVLFYF